ncbi:MAG: hypothetical protein E7556_07030 [Ruminococcaceae bacterium]|nr:hypothetical protein [Oscillospiraceae bacterium]
MSKSRKVLGALLAVVMVLSVLSISAFAAGATSYEDDASFTQSWSLGTPVSLGGNQYKVDVILSTNYPVGPVSFKLEGVTTVDEVAIGPGYYAGALYDKANSGLVLMVPDTAATVQALNCNNAVIATVTYTTSNANGAVAIEKSAKTADNPNGSLVASRCTGGTVNVSDFVVGQTTTVSGELIYEVTEDEPTPPATATLTGTNGGFVDEARGYVYGVPAKANPATYFSTTGYIEMVANAAGYTNGTGAKLNLYTDSSKGTLVKSYTLVIFGDLNNDSAVDVNDTLVLSKHVSATATIVDPVVLFASDVAEIGSGVDVNVNDLNALNKHVSAVLMLADNVRA